MLVNIGIKQGHIYSEWAFCCRFAVLNMLPQHIRIHTATADYAQSTCIAHSTCQSPAAGPYHTRLHYWIVNIKKLCNPVLHPIIYILSGICVWLGGRESWHIGASGIVYGLASFLFFSGVFRRDANLLTIGIIVVFLYGSMFWGIFPLKPEISWESHLWGAVSGLALAFYYRHQGPVRPVASWENEPEELDSDEEDYQEEISEDEPISTEEKENIQ